MEKFSGVVREIYAASAAPSRWPDTVGAVADALGAVQALLFTPCAGPEMGGVIFPWRVTEQDVIWYPTKYVHQYVWAKALRKRDSSRTGV
jgi:cytochrome c biogenesis protein CcdA